MLAFGTLCRQNPFWCIRNRGFVGVGSRRGQDKLLFGMAAGGAGCGVLPLPDFQCNQLAQRKLRGLGGGVTLAVAGQIPRGNYTTLTLNQFDEPDSLAVL